MGVAAWNPARYSRRMDPQVEKRTFFSRVMHFVLWPYRVFRAICLGIGFAVVVLMVVAGVFLASVHHSLPELSRTDYQVLKIRAQEVIFKKRENRQQQLHWTQLKDVSRDCLYSIVMSEDSNYFEHSGVDYDALVNSLALNLLKRKYEFGASTISQQVVRNLFLTNEKKISRKLKEIWITERLERSRSKNEILELYLNLAEFGRDLYGVREAADFYFKKKPSEINAAEGAFLALFLPSPRKYQYSIFENKNLPPQKQRKIRRVLGDLLAQELISQKQYKEYVNYDFFAERSRPPGKKPMLRK